MKKHLLYFALILACCGCAEDIMEENRNAVTIYGSVIDLKTGIPISNASVRLFNSTAIIASTYTGTDGSFSFNNVAIENIYTISVECIGYQINNQRVSLFFYNGFSGKDVEVQIAMRKIGIN